MKNIQFKTFGLKFDEVSDQGIIRGYASTFGNVDLGLDIVEKGAFKKSLKENKGVFPILADHNPSKQIGWNMKASEDDRGLLVEGKLNMEVQDAREKYALAKSAMELGAPMGLSIGYATIKAEPDRERPVVRRLKELKLYEYSIVTFPMNTEAMITAAKSVTGLDRATLIIKEFENNGIPREELASALRHLEAAGSSDPDQLVQSIDELIAQMRS